MFPGEMGQRHTVSRLGLSASAGMFFTEPETTPRSSPPATQEDATEVLPHTEQLTSFHQPNDKCSTKTPPRHTASGHNHAPVGGAEGRIGQQSSKESERLLLGVAAAAWKGSRGRPYKAESYGVRDLSCLVPAEGGSDCGCNLIYSGQPLLKNCRSSDGQDDNLPAGAVSLGGESAEGHIHQSPATDKVVGRPSDRSDGGCRGRRESETIQRSES